MAKKPLSKWIAKTCSCQTCQNMCREVPCWGTPQEIASLIRLGYGHRLMLHKRRHPRQNREIWVICPALRGREGKTCSYYTKSSGCNFQTANGLCSLHNICKPIEGRLAMCRGPEPINLRDQVLLTWDSDEAKNLIVEWKKQYYKFKR